jgi:glycosyltransferase involved in cell wall biosynthesis
MRIAVNTRMMIPGKMEGIGFFTYESMKRLTVSHPDHEFIFIFDRPFDDTLVFADNVTAVKAFPPARHPLLWVIWYEFSLPRIFKKYKPDIFIGTDGYLSLNGKVPSLSVMHDINFEHYPKDLPFFNRIFYRYFFPKYASSAKRIVAVSAFTKNDICKKYSIDPAKVDVVYNGVSKKFYPRNESEKNLTKEKYADGKEFFIYVGAIHSRKNISNMLFAYDEFRKSCPSEIKFILAGTRRWWTKEMEEALKTMEFKNDVIFTGRVSDEELCNLTAAAFALLYVSVFEGFGIPIIEAMASGTPVITSDITSMPEVAAGAALLCDPFSISSVSNAMISLFKDDSLRVSLIQKGLTRASHFSWEKTAAELWNSIEKMAGAVVAVDL